MFFPFFSEQRCSFYNITHRCFEDVLVFSQCICQLSCGLYWGEELSQSRDNLIGQTSVQDESSIFFAKSEFCQHLGVLNHRAFQCFWLPRTPKYVTLDHKTSHKGHLFKIEIYSLSKRWINKLWLQLTPAVWLVISLSLVYIIMCTL